MLLSSGVYTSTLGPEIRVLHFVCGREMIAKLVEEEACATRRSFKVPLGRLLHTVEQSHEAQELSAQERLETPPVEKLNKTILPLRGTAR